MFTKKMKPYYRDKGKYQDGRKRVIIEWLEGKGKRSFALPKPEKLLKLLDTKKNPETIKENTN